MPEPIITGKDLRVVYNLGKSNEYLALKIDDFEIYPQEYIILFGPSGCGKSTLLYSLLGVLPPTSGELLIKGENPYKYSDAKMVRFQQSVVGIIYQSFNLIPSLSVLDNVALPRIFANAPKAERERQGFALLRRFGVEAQARKLPTSLSGGQMQRIAVARSLVNDPEILLGDEPVGNLDSVSTKQVMDTLDEINMRDRKTIILVTHDAKHLPYAHRVYHMRDGKIVREVINPEKPQIKKVEKGKTILTEIEKLSRIFPYATPEELRVKSIVNFLTQELTFDQLQRLEVLVESFLNGRLEEATFLWSLRAPFDKGGAGVPERTAEEMVHRVSKIVTDARNISRFRRRFEERVKSSKQQERIIDLRKSLLDAYEGQVTLEELGRLEGALQRRVSGLMTLEEFREELHKPLEQGGIGFHTSTAHRFSQHLEKLIAQGTHL
ncbi:MAG: ABC transporter ATP-binding protein [Patescibacteria group bacterium]